MKKKIIIILSVVSLFFSLGGVYLIRAIDTNAARFEEIIMFHQVEIQREDLLLQIRRVEADLYSQSTQHAESAGAVENHVIEMKMTINACFNCHHTEEVVERLQDLHHQIEQYGQALSRVMNLKKSAGPLRAELESSHHR
jgi:hypothetical protein